MDFNEVINKYNIKTNEKMAKHTSFKAGGISKYFVKISNIDDLIEIVKCANYNNINIVVIGNGTNILFRDGLYDGLVIQICLNNIEVYDNKIIAGAGIKLGALAKCVLDNSFDGMSYIAGIPGTVGGAIRMNAGAYGGEISNNIESVTYYDIKKNIIKTISNKQCKFSYRKSIFSSNKYIILSAIFNLEKGNKEDIKKQMNEYNRLRMEKQPLEFPSAGSTFKRGNGFITSQLIDECGLKGYTIGGAQVSTKHAGFIINTGNATAEDILNLVDYVKNTVKRKTGNDIELEVIII